MVAQFDGFCRSRAGFLSTGYATVNLRSDWNGILGRIFQLRRTCGAAFRAGPRAISEVVLTLRLRPQS
jgi:hypothetical protein